MSDDVVVNAETDPFLQKKPSNSHMIVFSCWTTMCGSTLLALPWGFRNAGAIAGISICIFVFLISQYTCVLVYHQGSERNYSDIVRDHLGKVGSHMTTITGVLVLLTAMESYHIIMVGCITDMAPSVPGWILTLVIGFFVFLSGFLESVKPLFRLASYGVIFLIFNIVFIIVKSVLALTEGSGKCLGEEIPNATSSISFGMNSIGGVAQLASVLSLSFYLHNVVFSITVNATRPENNARDIRLGYVSTLISYALPAVLSVFAFQYCPDATMKPKGSFLDVFSSTDIYAGIGRVCFVAQSGVVYPLLFYIVRNDCRKYLVGEKATTLETALINGILVCILMLPSLLDLGLNIVLSIMGSICGGFWVFGLPAFVHMSESRGKDSFVWSLVTHGFIFLIGVGLVVISLLHVFGVI